MSYTFGSVGHLFLQSESGFSGLYDYQDKKGRKLTIGENNLENRI